MIRRRSGRADDELARLLDGTLAGPPSPEVTQAGRVAEQLSSARPALEELTVLRPEFREELRTRLTAVAAVQAGAATSASGRAAGRWRAGSGRAALAAGTAASLVAVTGIGLAASRSLPGDPLYGVKLTAEAVQLRTAAGPYEVGLRHLQFAETRLREVGRLTRDEGLAAGLAGRGLRWDGGVPDGAGVVPGAAVAAVVAAGGSSARAGGSTRVVAALADMDQQTDIGSRLLAVASRHSRSTAPLVVLQGWSDTQAARLAQLLPRLPGGAQQRAQVSLALIDGVARHADDLLRPGACAAACDPSTRSRAPSGTSRENRRPSCPCPSSADPAGSGATPGAGTPPPDGTLPSDVPPTGSAPVPDDTPLPGNAPAPGAPSAGSVVPAGPPAAPGAALPASPPPGAPAGGSGRAGSAAPAAPGPPAPPQATSVPDPAADGTPPGPTAQASALPTSPPPSPTSPPPPSPLPTPAATPLPSPTAPDSPLGVLPPGGGAAASTLLPATPATPVPADAPPPAVDAVPGPGAPPGRMRPGPALTGSLSNQDGRTRTVGAGPAGSGRGPSRSVARASSH